MDNFVVAFANTKGGVGKTTGSFYFAAAAHHAGHSVTIIDTDVQGSASSWFAAAQATPDTALPNLSLSVANQYTLAQETQREGIVIIDTPPGHAAIVDGALKAADFVIIPTNLSTLDMERVWNTLAIIPEGTPAAVLLNQANPRTILYREITEIFEKENIAVFPAYIPERQEFKKMHGRWPENDARQMLGYEHVFEQTKSALS